MLWQKILSFISPSRKPREIHFSLSYFDFWGAPSPTRWQLLEPTKEDLQLLQNRLA